jgi:hypothetical protein
MTKVYTLPSSESMRDTQPGGARFGASFNWGIAVSQTINAVSSLIGQPIGPPLSQLAAWLSLVFVLLLVILGEALRRGNGVARRLQIGLHALFMIIGIPVILLPQIQLVQQGRLDMLITVSLAVVFLYVVSPIAIWLLMQKGSQRWYGNVTVQEALARHSGGWLVGTLLWAVGCGVLQAVAPY